jgi:hypothetical protein
MNKLGGTTSFARLHATTDILNDDECSDIVHRTSTGVDFKMEAHESEKGWWQRRQIFSYCYGLLKTDLR